MGGMHHPYCINLKQIKIGLSMLPHRSCCSLANSPELRGMWLLYSNLGGGRFSTQAVNFFLLKLQCDTKSKIQRTNSWLSGFMLRESRPASTRSAGIIDLLSFIRVREYSLCHSGCPWMLKK
jgi:hypothetical protein